MSLAMRIGDALLSAGMSANDAVVRMLRITEAFGLPRVHIDVTYNSIVASYSPTPEEIPVTAIRVAENSEIDCDQVQRINALAGDIHAGMPIDQATSEFDAIERAPHPYARWVETVGAAGVDAAVLTMFTSSWKLIVIAFAVGCVIDRLLGSLRSRGVPVFFQQLAASALITLLAAGMNAAARNGATFFVGVDPTLVVVGGIFMLFAGMMIVGAVQDAIDQFYVTASARVFEVLMRTAGLIIGIVSALYLARWMGAPVSISSEPVRLGPLPLQFLGATLTPMAYALSRYSRPSTIALSGAMGFVGWTGFHLTGSVGLGVVPASTVGAFAAALVATLMIRRTTVPGFELIGAALIPMVPGLLLYTGLIQMVGTDAGTGSVAEGGMTLLLAMAIATGIAMGASFGTYLGRPVADRLHRIRARASGIAGG